MYKNAKKLIIGLIVASAIVILPVLGNTAILRAPQLWILILIGLLGSLFQPEYNPFKRASNNKDKGTANQIIWTIYISQLAAILEASYLRYPESILWNWITTIALLLMTAGLFVRSWAVFTLGNYFTWHISVQKDQKVIRSGPYAYIRHPGYFGAFITYASTAIFLQAWFSLAINAVILLAAFIRRIYHEETALKNSLGAAYESYTGLVKRFIPGIW